MRDIYGPDVIDLPKVSIYEPHAIREHGDFFEFEYRQPFRPNGGGYIKTFRVNKQTGDVTYSDVVGR